MHVYMCISLHLRIVVHGFSRFLVPKPREKGRTFGSPCRESPTPSWTTGSGPSPGRTSQQRQFFRKNLENSWGDFPKKWVSLAPWPDMARYGQLSLSRCVFGEAFRASLHRSLVVSIPRGRCLVLAGPMSQETFV